VSNRGAIREEIKMNRQTIQKQRQDQVLSVQGPMQIKSPEGLVQKLLEISRWKQQSIKPSMGLS
jgi:hypothetical protein